MTEFEHKLTGNIWKNTLILIGNKRVFIAILGAFYLTIPGVMAKEIGTLLLVGTFTTFLFEIPSGYASDKFGHKNTIVLSRLAILLSSVTFLFAHSLFALCIASALLSLGQAFWSGTGSAFMHETLRDLGRDSEYAAVAGKASAIGFAIPAVLMAIVPFLVSYSIRAPFVVGLLMDFAGLVVALTLTTPRVVPGQVEEIRNTNFMQVLREGYEAGFFRLALFSGLTSGILLAVGGFRAPYQAELGVPIIYFGIFFGAGRALASLMLAYSGKLRTILTLRSFYLFQLIVYTLMIVALGRSKTPWIIVGLFMISNAFTWGLSQIDSGYMLDTIRQSKFKATLLSVSSQIDSLFGAAAAYGMGLAIATFSYRGGFLIMAVSYVAVGIPLLIYLARGNKKGPYARGQGGT